MLADRAASTAAEEPWLFCRGCIHWIWRSFRQVADQVARATAELGRRSRSIATKATVGPSGSWIAFDGRGLPDQVAIDLTLQNLGCGALATSGQLLPSSLPSTVRLWVDSDQVPSRAADELVTVARLPNVRSRLDRWQDVPLVPSRSALGTALFSVGGRFESLSQRDLIDAASRLDGFAPSLEERPIILSQVGLDRPEGRVLMAWTLLRKAVWVMEPESSAFVATALWARPHLVVADPDQLDELATALELKSYRRWHRLRGVISLDRSLAAGQLAESWKRQRIAVARFPLPAASRIP